jgi:hypothetical protein
VREALWVDDAPWWTGLVRSRLRYRYPLQIVLSVSKNSVSNIPGHSCSRNHALALIRAISNSAGNSTVRKQRVS